MKESALSNVVSSSHRKDIWARVHGFPCCSRIPPVFPVFEFVTEAHFTENEMYYHHNSWTEKKNVWENNADDFRCLCTSHIFRLGLVGKPHALEPKGSWFDSLFIILKVMNTTKSSVCIDSKHLLIFHSFHFLESLHAKFKHFIFFLLEVILPELRLQYCNFWGPQRRNLEPIRGWAHICPWSHV